MMDTSKPRPLALLAIAFFMICPAAVSAAERVELPFWDYAPAPPMGWNSYDCFGLGATETDVKANADYMAEKLAKHGWQYIVIDHQWYEEQANGFSCSRTPRVVMDDYGRLQPTTIKFPSATDGQGFKPLADYVHGKGLKFGLHLMRGIPRAAVEKNTLILGTNYRAVEIADTTSSCSWCVDMNGVDVSKPGAQEYYDSVFKMFAGWGVDYVKIDDLSFPYSAGEIEAIRKAIDACGRPIVFSTSPGATPLAQGAHIMQHANLWRISDDFWDDWNSVKAQFKRLHEWTPFRGPGHWPDADMLPLGNIRARNAQATKGGPWTRLTHDEQVTLMTLWCITRSPLIMGGNLPKNDAFTLSLLTNDKVLKVNQTARNPRQLFNRNGLIAWIASYRDEVKVSYYLALFNTTESEQSIIVTNHELRMSSMKMTRNLWNGRLLWIGSSPMQAQIPPHGAGLYEIYAEGMVRQ